MKFFVFSVKCLDSACYNSPNLYLHSWVSTETSVLSDVDFVLCLDSIAKTDQLFLHVSKPPKEGTPAFTLVEVCTTRYSALLACWKIESSGKIPSTCVCTMHVQICEHAGDIHKLLLRYPKKLSKVRALLVFLQDKVAKNINLIT